MEINTISREVIRLAMKVHSNLGPGLLEKIYQECLRYEFDKAGMRVESQLSLPVIYDKIKIDLSYLSLIHI